MVTSDPPHGSPARGPGIEVAGSHPGAAWSLRRAFDLRGDPVRFRAPTFPDVDQMNPTHHTIGPLPEPLSGLRDIALDLAWTWMRDARRLFRSLDPTLWAETRENPVRLLKELPSGRLQECAEDPEFLALLESVRGQMAVLASDDGTWFSVNHPELAGRTVAYFCAEFAVHHSVPIYAGGLGVLAGDHLKCASDLGVPLVAVGLLYRHGYFDQRFDDDGRQVSEDEVFDPSVLPLTRLEAGAGPGLASVRLEGRTVHLSAWEMRVGRTRVFLIDTNLQENAEQDRELTARLYEDGEELRLKQEWILGVGGVRVLRAVGIEPTGWHANEGHAAFMMLERARELVERGSSLDEAVREVRSRSVFTTHTPVAAGHDDFHLDQIQSILDPVWEELGVDAAGFMRLGKAPGDDDDVFHMTAAAIRMSSRINGVSAQHGEVSRRIWQGLWPDKAPDDVPIGHVTNGVHRWTWMASRIQCMLDEELGAGWEARVQDPALWDRVLSIPDERVWQVHLGLKRHSAGFLREQARVRWRDQWTDAKHFAAAGPLLDPEVLTLGFARRFTSYKRADLLLRDEERLRRLLTDPHRPVQLIYAGKAHPADDEGQRILERIHQLAWDPRNEGRVAFVEDYDMHLARALFQGVDVWLNLPRAPMEASGTSGMKAALNMVPQLGTHDGWWAEGFDGENGWIIPIAADLDDPDEEDWEHVFRILEDQVVPLYHDRNGNGVPVGWARRMKRALWVAGRDFTADRMLRDYVASYYAPALSPEGIPEDGGAPTA